MKTSAGDRRGDDAKRMYDLAACLKAESGEVSVFLKTDAVDFVVPRSFLADPALLRGMLPFLLQ